MRMAAKWLVQRVRRLGRREEGMQTLEWILLIGLIGVVLLGLMKWFSDNQATVGQTVWDVVKSWLDKAKAPDS